MRSSFEADAHLGRPRILFVGIPESSHTHAWIDLLNGASFNVRLFGVPTGVPPDEWGVRTYVTTYGSQPLDSTTRARLYPANRVGRFVKRQAGRLVGATYPEELAARWLAKIIKRWQPDIIHTLGFDQGEFYFDARNRYKLDGIGKWVLQLRGGSDLALTHLDPTRVARLVEVLGACDQLLSDNQKNFRIAREMEVSEEQLSRIGTVPGTGGIDVAALAGRHSERPSRRRILLWPKAYESPWGKVLPIFEALKLCWERVQPCEVRMLSMNDEARMWYWTLPPHIREFVHPFKRIPRARVLEMMSEARVMLAPSLVDGVPNSMYEAMTAGALPIVSPLETIVPVVENERNVLFARNLYPQEIADALTRAMNDDRLVDEAAERNLALVRKLADRREIRPRVVAFYEALARS